MILPTFNRPKGLRKALTSLSHQSAGDRTLEIIVVDNDPDGSAARFVRAFAKGCEIPIHYIHAKQPGVANARNMALSVARGHYLAFLDDDQIAAPNWLSTLIKQAESFSAGLVFCPTHAQSDLNVRHKGEYLKFFGRNIHQQGSQLVEDFFGCGNSLLDLRKCALPKPAFCPTTNETGGEDDKLFSYIQNQGIRIVWTGDTHALEDVDDARMNLDYIRKRSFAYGQGPSRICANPENFDVIGIIKWTIIGTGQFFVYGPLSLIFRLFGSPKSVWFMRKASEGAGKALWFESLRPRLYGRSWLKRKRNMQA